MDVVRKVDDAVLHDRLQLLLVDSKRRLHLVERLHKVVPPDLNLVDIVRNPCHRPDLPPPRSALARPNLEQGKRTLTCRLNAKLVALLTKPPISAPEKFFVIVANSTKSTSWPMTPFVRILLVWIWRIWILPASSGSEISMWTSSRPGRRRASSIMSSRFVMPMMRMLFNWSTPSICARG